MELLQIALHAKDLDRAAPFYERLLGRKPTASFDPPGLVFFELGRTRLLLDRAAPAALLYLAVDDVRQRVEDLRADGVAVDTEAHMIFRHDDTLGPCGARGVAGVYPRQRGQSRRPGQPASPVTRPQARSTPDPARHRRGGGRGTLRGTAAEASAGPTSNSPSARLLTSRPDVRWLTTTNEASNTAILPVNAALGFRTVAHRTHGVEP